MKQEMLAALAALRSLGVVVAEGTDGKSKVILVTEEVLDNPELLQILKDEYGIEPAVVPIESRKFEILERPKLDVSQILDLNMLKSSRPKYFVPKKIGKVNSRCPRRKRW